ncbi:MAG: septum formation family protein [Gemmatimonadetes bacterium]|nr:septum formation family protein [Gemmatimonadota bacterium]
MPRHRVNCFSTLFLLVASACAPAERGDSGEIETAGSVDAFAIQVGDCFDDQSGFSDEVSDVPGVPCSVPHDNEVYATFDLEAGEWPGEELLNELADEGCLERFASAIGADYDDSVLVIGTLMPSKQSWGQRKDREVVCVAYHMELEKLTGSVLRSGM